LPVKKKPRIKKTKRLEKTADNPTGITLAYLILL